MTSENLLDAARDVLQRSVGLRLDPAQRCRLDYWLHHTAELRGVPDSEIVDEIAAEGPALQSVLDELTVQETSFFRDKAQFDAFRGVVVPMLMSPVTVWSAGCAGGHEPYSIAMVLAESGIESWRVVASDISSRALRQAQSGRYEERQLAGLSERDRGLYLRRAGDEWEVVPELRAQVSVFRHNLIRDPAPKQAAGATVVFCRNVLIYFDRPDVLAALKRIASTMDPRGWVFLGYSESLWQVTEDFRLAKIGGAFAYRRPEALPRAISATGLALDCTSRGGGDPRKPRSNPRADAAPAAEASRPPVPPAARLGSAAAPRPARAEHDGRGGDPSISALLAEGEAELQAGDVGTAVAVLRKVVYLDPDHAIAHFQLGLAFELLGERGQARRAFGAARAALGRASAAAEAALEGYQIGELVRLLDRRLARPAPT